MSKRIAVFVTDEKTYISVLDQSTECFVLSSFSINELLNMLKNYKQHSVSVCISHSWVKQKQIEIPKLMSSFTLKKYTQSQIKNWFPDLTLETETIIHRKNNLALVTLIPKQLKQSLHKIPNLKELFTETQNLEFKKPVNLSKNKFYIKLIDLGIGTTFITLIGSIVLNFQLSQAEPKPTFKPINKKVIRLKQTVAEHSLQNINQFELLVMLAKDTPKNMMINSFQLEGNHMTIKGHCPNLKTLDEFLKNFKPTFYQFKSRQQNGALGFTLNYEIKA